VVRQDRLARGVAVLLFRRRVEVLECAGEMQLVKDVGEVLLQPVFGALALLLRAGGDDDEPARERTPSTVCHEGCSGGCATTTTTHRYPRCLSSCRRSFAPGMGAARMYSPLAYSFVWHHQPRFSAHLPFRHTTISTVSAGPPHPRFCQYRSGVSDLCPITTPPRPRPPGCRPDRRSQGLPFWLHSRSLHGPTDRRPPPVSGSPAPLPPFPSDQTDPASRTMLEVVQRQRRLHPKHIVVHCIQHRSRDAPSSGATHCPRWSCSSDYFVSDSSIERPPSGPTHHNTSSMSTAIVPFHPATGVSTPPADPSDRITVMSSSNVESVMVNDQQQVELSFTRGYALEAHGGMMTIGHTTHAATQPGPPIHSTSRFGPPGSAGPNLRHTVCRVTHPVNLCRWPSSYRLHPTNRPVPSRAEELYDMHVYRSRLRTVRQSRWCMLVLLRLWVTL